MLKNREVADIVKECVLKGGMSRADILQEVRKRGHTSINSVATIKDYITRLRDAGELPMAVPGANLKYQGVKPKTKKKPEIQKPRKPEILKSRKEEIKKSRNLDIYEKVNFQITPDQALKIRRYAVNHKKKISEIVREALDKFFKGRA